jgi:predicted nucleotidyltransferase
MELPSGEILTVVGSYRGLRARGRLTYIPDDDGTVRIFGRRYRKTSYEVGSVIPHARRVLALPGESHYTVPARYITRHHPAVPLESTRPELAELAEALFNADVPVSLGGSRALKVSRSQSNYDLVIYGKGNVDRAARVITRLDGYRPEVHCALRFAHDKYRHFTRLTRNDLDLLVGGRWRHFRLHGLAVSVDGADTDWLADLWASGPVRRYDAAHIRGVVLDGAQSYISPKIIDVQTDTGTVRVFTWLNLYAGALRTGDQVAVYGRWIVVHGHQFVLVEDSTHAIHVVARASADPV